MAIQSLQIFKIGCFVTSLPLSPLQKTTRPSLWCSNSHLTLLPIELRGFAPIGILEYWNDGILDFDRLGKKGYFYLLLENEIFF